jgi:carbamoyl-phosphate synthase large subunit
MQSVGEAMAIGRTFRESIQKAYRSLEVGLHGMDPKETQYRKLDLGKLGYPTSFRLLKVKQAMEEGHEISDIHEQTKIDPWFLNEIKRIVDIKNKSAAFNKKNVIELKREGFSDIQIGIKYKKTENEVRNFRKENNVVPTYKVVDTCAAEFEALTPYSYSLKE